MIGLFQNLFRLQLHASHQVANNLGKPDNIVMMKNAPGDVDVGMWGYPDAALKVHGILDANFMIIKGQMQYVTFTDSY
jgi:hypothetical protein